MSLGQVHLSRLPRSDSLYPTTGELKELIFFPRQLNIINYSTRTSPLDGTLWFANGLLPVFKARLPF